MKPKKSRRYIQIYNPMADFSTFHTGELLAFFGDQAPAGWSIELVKETDYLRLILKTPAGMNVDCGPGSIHDSIVDALSRMRTAIALNPPDEG